MPLCIRVSISIWSVSSIKFRVELINSRYTLTNIASLPGTVVVLFRIFVGFFSWMLRDCLVVILFRSDLFCVQAILLLSWRKLHFLECNLKPVSSSFYIVSFTSISCSSLLPFISIVTSFSRVFECECIVSSFSKKCWYVCQSKKFSQENVTSCEFSSCKCEFT